MTLIQSRRGSIPERRDTSEDRSRDSKSGQSGSLDTVTRFLAELQNERAQLNQDLERVLHEKVSLVAEVKDFDRQIEELKRKKAEVDSRLSKLTITEQELRTKQLVDVKIATVTEESTKFERSLRSLGSPAAASAYADTVSKFSSLPSLPTSGPSSPSAAPISRAASSPAGSLPSPAAHREEADANDNSIKTLCGHTDAVLSVDFDAPAQLLISGSVDRTVKVWDLQHGALILSLPGHTGWVKTVHLRGFRAVSGSADHTVRLWNLANARCLEILRGHAGGVSCVRMDDVRILSGSVDRTIKVWDPDLGICTGTLSGHTEYVTCLQNYDYGLASGSGDRSVRMWDLRAKSCQRTLEAHGAGVTCLQFDNQKLITGSLDCTCKVWDLRTGSVLHDISLDSPVTDLSFSQSVLAICANDKTPKVYDCASYAPIFVLQGHLKNVLAVKVADNQAATASADYTVKLWKIV